MLFSSIAFLFYFLPILLILYFLIPQKGRNIVLLLGSLVFYGWGEPRYLLLMIFSILQGYLLGLAVAKAKERKAKTRAKLWCILSVVLSLGALGIFKYASFSIETLNKIANQQFVIPKIALPIGISFYTFQILSYSIDIYLDRCKVQKNLISFATYVSMFPQLIAGPIVRYSDIEKELANRTHSLSAVAGGIRRFLLGLAKKVLIANSLGILTEQFHSHSAHTVLFVWLYAIAYSLQIYFDFSGYSDMAIGLGEIMGFHFPENFNYPFISRSVTEFWRRWHMTLGSWFRDYLYIPLGGNRVSMFRWGLNILIVWMTTGLWHGASWNFVIWGLFFAILLVAEKFCLMKYLKKYRIFSHIYLCIAILVSFVIFDHTEISQGITVLKEGFGLGQIPFADQESLYLLKSYAPILILASLGATPLPKALWKKIAEKMQDSVFCLLEPAILTMLLAVITAFLVDGSYNPFLYFRF